jgi:hypothetical protein
MERCLTELLRSHPARTEASVGTVRLADLPAGRHRDPLPARESADGAAAGPLDAHLHRRWAQKSQVELPYTISHETAGWVHAVGRTRADPHVRSAGRPVPLRAWHCRAAPGVPGPAR